MIPLRSDTPCPPVLRAYMNRLGLEGSVLREDVSLRLRVDHRYVIALQPASHGQLALLATVADLAAWPSAQTDTRLLDLLTQSAGLVRDHASGLVIDDQGQRLQLQQVLPPDTEVGQLEQALEDFLNLLEFWTRACEAMEHRCAGPLGVWP